MADSRISRIAFSTSALSADEPDSFDRAFAHIRDWLGRQAREFNLDPLTWNEPLEQRRNDDARLISQIADDSVSFAFAHDDQHDENTSWHVLTAITKRANSRVQVDVEVAAEGVEPPLIPPLGMPGFMIGIVNDVGLVDVRRLSSVPVVVSRGNAGEFADFLRDPNRKLPIVAFSQPLPLTGDDIERISRRIAGAAHIALVETDASFIVSDRIGKEFSVYQGAVRVYTPNLPRDPHQIKLYFPATIQKYNTEERANGPFGTIRFADVLVRATLDRRMWPSMPQTRAAREAAPVQRPSVGTVEIGASAVIIPEEAKPETAPALEVSEAMTAIVEESKRVVSPPESAVHAIILPEAERIADLERQLDAMRAARDEAEAARDRSEADAAKNEEAWYNAQMQMENLQRQIEDLQSLGGSITVAGATEADTSVLRSMVDAAMAVKSMIERTTASEATANQLRFEVDELRKESGRLRMRIDSLERRSAAPDEQQPEPSRPDDYREVDALEAYLSEKHDGCIVLAPSAKGTLKKGEYADAGRLIDMLDLLASPYCAMKMGHGNGEAYETFEAAKEALRVKVTPALKSGSDARKHYQFTWKGRPVAIEDIMHIRDVGTTYSPERMASVYFIWDDEDRQTVVLSGPAKLPTSADHS